jgi:ubiquinone/menaquinone biosynthesis C-methylase UbiE
MDEFSAPENNLSQLNIEEGMRIADLGAGSGHYSFAASPLVGDTGKVFSVEVQKELVQRIKNEAQNRKLSNIDVMWGDIEESQGTKLADRAVDIALLSNVLFQVEDISATLREAHRIIKPGGRLLIVDWSESFGGMGPQPESVLAADKARALGEEVGFTYDSALTVGAHHYGFVMKKVS